jgi:hypothetical protein
MTPDEPANPSDVRSIDAHPAPVDSVIATTATEPPRPPGMPSAPSEIAFGLSIQQASHASSGFLSKMTPENITQVITEAARESERRYYERIIGFSLASAGLLSVLLTLLALCFLFLTFQHPEYLQGIIGAVVGLVGGGAGGFGIGRATAPKPESPKR